MRLCDLIFQKNQNSAKVFIYPADNTRGILQ